MKKLFSSAIVLGIIGTVMFTSTGCKSLTGCDKETKTIDVYDSDLFPTVLLDMYEKEGWTCAYKGPIRSADGTRIGEKNECTICR